METRGWTIQVLGGLTVRQGAQTISRFRTRKTGALLAYLALHGGRPVARDVLFDALWPGSALPEARNSLSVALSSLRGVLEEPSPEQGASPLGGVLQADRNAVWLHPDAFTCDAASFEAALRRARQNDDVDAWRAAVGAYGGELLPGYYDDWVVDERDRLADLHRQALRGLADRLIAQGRPDDAVDVAHRLVQADPSSDVARALLERLRPKESAPLPPTPAPQPGPAPGNIPLLLTRFFGRIDEIEALSERIGDASTRLVTLTGPGGAGKTRLAIEVARRANPPGGVWFVPLADQSEPGQIVAALRDALQLPRTAAADPLDQIAERLTDQPALVVLDNLEHLLGRGPTDPHGAAAVLRALRARLPAITWLATSRRALGSAGEVEHPLPLLPADDAVQLFVDRARQRRPDFAVTARNAPTVTRLVERLEGIPLAIELAAAWAKLLTPAQMLDRLEARFDLLVSRNDSVPERHRSLRAAVEWGYALLSPETQRLFDALSVFRGDWSAEDAEAICDTEGEGRTLERLGLLRDASLVRADEGVEEMRFSLLETLRAYADERLDDDRRAALQQRHAERFLAQAETAYRAIRGPDQQRAFDRLEAALPNVNIALERRVDTPLGLQLTGVLAYFWKLRGLYVDGRRWLERALAAADGAPSVAHARAWNGLGMIAEDHADYAVAGDAYRRSRAMFAAVGHESGIVIATQNEGNVAYRQGDLAAAGRLYGEALAAYRARGEAHGVAAMLGSLANVAQEEGDLDAALRLQSACLAEARAIGDARMVAYTLHNLGNLAALRGDTPAALSHYQESLIGKEALGDRRGVASLHNSLASLALEAGHTEGALPHLREALQTLRTLGNRHYMVTSLEALAWCATVTGHPEHASRLWGASVTARERLAAPRSGPEEARYAPLIATARTQYPSEWEFGARGSLEDAADRALAHIRTHFPDL